MFFFFILKYAEKYSALTDGMIHKFDYSDPMVRSYLLVFGLLERKREDSLKCIGIQYLDMKLFSEDQPGVQMKMEPRNMAFRNTFS